ncbi:MAG: hypothetical protein WCE72_01155, partial [Pseudolabrys sp.]
MKSGTSSVPHSLNVGYGRTASNPPVIFQAKQHVSIFEALVFIAESFNLECSGGLKCLHTRPAYDCCLVAIRRSPVNFGIGTGVEDREENRMPLTIINDRLWPRSTILRARAHRFKRIDLTEIDHLGACAAGVKKHARAKQRQDRDMHERPEPHGFRISNRLNETTAYNPHHTSFVPA